MPGLRTKVRLGGELKILNKGREVRNLSDKSKQKMFIKLQQITRPGVVIRQKLANSEKTRESTNGKSMVIIRLNLNLHNYILDN